MTGPITAPAIHVLFCRSGSGPDRSSDSGLGVACITSSLLVDTSIDGDADTTRVGVGTTSVEVTLRGGGGAEDVRVLNDVVVAGNSR